MKVRIRLSVSGKALPACVTVRDTCGRVLFSEITRRRVSEFAFCSRVGEFYVAVAPISGEYPVYARFIRLFGMPCPVVCLKYDFPERPLADWTIYLFDANYGLPVKTAELYFTRL